MKTNSVKWTCPACVGPRGQIQELPIATQINEDMDPNGLEDRDMFKVLNSTMGRNGMKIAHLNVNGLLSKPRQIEMLMQYCQLDILAITETHLNWKVSDNEISIDGYEIERFDRDGKSGGGSLLYYRSCLTVTPVKGVVKVKCLI
eukprot:Seg3486.1 transcript_id=Seg3486.1/GoldUCD/mRNA.D3Y31 product="hypothetical protein" protein_id=Seg3486.1/GoldUCD/D3Y31